MNLQERIEALISSRHNNLREYGRHWSEAWGMNPKVKHSHGHGNVLLFKVEKIV